MELEKEIYLIADACRLLNEKEILQCLDNNPSLFRLRQDKVQIVNKNFTSYISIEEFKTLYSEFKFIIYEASMKCLIQSNRLFYIQQQININASYQQINMVKLEE